MTLRLQSMRINGGKWEALGAEADLEWVLIKPRTFAKSLPDYQRIGSSHHLDLYPR